MKCRERRDAEQARIEREERRYVAMMDAEQRRQHREDNEKRTTRT